MMRKGFLHIVVMFMVLLSSVVSCHEEMRMEETPSVPEGKDICFDVSGRVVTRTSDEALSRHLLLVDGSDSLFLTASVAENTSLSTSCPASSGSIEEIPTKGTVTTAENLGTFRVSAYFGDGTAYFSSLEVSESADGYAHTGYYWPDRHLNFFAGSHSPSDLSYLVEEGECSGAFSYTLPAPDSETMNDAAAQEDYVFAIAPDMENDGGPVPLHFHHAFSAICFKMGSMPMPSDGRVINYIGLKNVPSSGSCTFGPDADGGIEFLWTETDGSEAYMQKIDGDRAAGELINGDGIIFMMLPHTLSSAEIVISFTLHDDNGGYAYEYVITKALKDITPQWEANKKYTYVISAPEEVDVEVGDLVTANVKHDVEIINPGLSTVYIRAAIIGAWVNERGEIISPWISNEAREDVDGIFDWGSDWGNHWAKGSDGFYYHKSPVVRDGKTWPLFKTYTLNSAPPVLGAVLELSIIAQAVRYDQLATAWPDAPVGTE